MKGISFGSRRIIVSDEDRFGEMTEADEDVLTDIVLPKKLKQLKAIGIREDRR